MKKADQYKFSYYIKMCRAKDYYENNKELLIEKATYKQRII